MVCSDSSGQEVLDCIIKVAKQAIESKPVDSVPQ